jgi:hypothetical protein
MEPRGEPSDIHIGESTKYSARRGIVVVRQQLSSATGSRNLVREPVGCLESQDLPTRLQIGGEARIRRVILNRSPPRERIQGDFFRRDSILLLPLSSEDNDDAFIPWRRAARRSVGVDSLKPSSMFSLRINRWRGMGWAPMQWRLVGNATTKKRQCHWRWMCATTVGRPSASRWCAT